MISKQKLALIHVGKKELGWSEEVYRHVLRDHGGVDSARDLDKAGAKRVIDHTKAMGFWIKRNFEQQRPRSAGATITPDQLKVIDHLWHDLAEFIPGARTHAKLPNRLLGARHQTPWPQTRAQANALTEALKTARPARHVRAHSSARIHLLLNHNLDSPPLGF